MKNIEWLKEEVNDYLDIEGVEDARMALKAVLGYIDQLDEPETLSQEWIDGRKVARISNLRRMTTSDVVPVEDLESLIVPKEQTSSPVIPSWFANWFEDGGYEKSVYGTLNYLYTVHKRKMNEWAEQLENGHTELQIIIAGICDKGIGSYTVEEKKYLVVLPHKDSEGYKMYLTTTDDGELDEEDLWFNTEVEKEHYSVKLFKYEFTEQEIKKINNGIYWPFAEEVTE